MSTPTNSIQSPSDLYFGLWCLEDLGKSPEGTSRSKRLDRGGESSPVDSVLRNAKHREIAQDRFITTDRQTIIGGYGTVHRMYLKMPSGNGLLVAVKKLHDTPEIRKRLAREIKVWIPLKHPNVLPFLGYYWGAPNEAWLVSPFCTQGSVRNYLLKSKPSMEHRLELLCDTARGLQYLHEQAPSICHGDLKGDNVVVNSQNRAMLCDFGLAKALNGPAGPTGLTSQTQKGTVRYFSPELAHAKPDQTTPTTASDVWAWACLGLEILVDTIPFVNEPDGKIYVSLSDPITAHPSPLTAVSLSPDLKYMFRHCWNYEPDERPLISTITRILSDLDRTTLQFGQNAYSALAPRKQPPTIVVSSSLPQSDLRNNASQTKRALRVNVSDEGNRHLVAKDTPVSGAAAIFRSLSGKVRTPQTPRHDPEASAADSAPIAARSATSVFFSLKRRRSAKDGSVPNVPVEDQGIQATTELRRAGSSLSRSRSHKRNKRDNHAQPSPEAMKDIGNNSTQDRNQEQPTGQEPMNVKDSADHSAGASGPPGPRRTRTTAAKDDLSPDDELAPTDGKTSSEKRRKRERPAAPQPLEANRSNVALTRSASTKSDQMKPLPRLPSESENSISASVIGMAL